MRPFLVQSALFLVIALATAIPSASAQTSNVTLRIGVFGGPFGDLEKAYTGDRLTRLTGIKSEFVAGNPSDFVAQLIANKGRQAPYDIVLLDEIAQAQAIQAGVVAKLDPALVPNLQLLYPQARQPQGYGPDVLYFSVGIVYNKVKFKEAGLPDPTSWEDLWDPKLAGHVSVPDISLGHGVGFIAKIARMNGGSEDRLEPGLDKIAKIKAHSYYTSSSTVGEQVAAGDVWATVMTSGRAWGLIDRNLPVGYVLPKEGGVAGRDSMELVAGTQHPKEAQMFINLALDPIRQLGFAMEMSWGPANSSLTPLLAAYPEIARKFPASPEEVATLYMPDSDLFTANRKKAVDYWNRNVKK